MSYTEQRLWEIYTEKNPHWKTKNITLTPDGLQKLVKHSYNHGYNHAISNYSKVNENPSGTGHQSVPPKTENDFMDLFNDILGK